MSIQTPLINGFYPSYADIELNLNGLHIVGVTSISYDDDLKRSYVYGTQKVPLGLSTGKYVPNGEIELLLPQAQLVLDTLGLIGLAFGGFRFAPIGVTVSYAPVSPLPLITDDFVCYLGKQDAKNKVSDDALTRTFGLYIAGTINWGGNPGAIDLNSLGAAG